MNGDGRKFEKVFFLDFEFHQPDGEKPTPLCMVAKEYHSGEIVQVWFNKGEQPLAAPLPVDKNTLVVAYLASAEMACFQALGWEMPPCVIDLYAEFCLLTNGRHSPLGKGLLGALAHFGENVLDVTEKQDMRELAIRGGPYTEAEMRDLLAYCQRDVLALERLWNQMRPHLDGGRSLLRGQYMKAVAKIEMVGIPIDRTALADLCEYWEIIKASLIEELGQPYGVYQNGKFKTELFVQYLKNHNIPWPSTPTGKPKTDADTFKEKAGHYPELKPLKELQHLLGKLKLNKLQVGKDGRNRYLSGVFGSITGRNQPSNSKCIFGLPAWMRRLIQPEPGFGLVYLDYEQQEFGIAAALSEDEAMKQAYVSGDPYLAFAIQAGAAPREATKASHEEIRNKFKATALGVQYGMGRDRLMLNLNTSKDEADRLLALHRQTYSKFWRWQEDLENKALLEGSIGGVLGWKMSITAKTKSQTLGNFPMQANGAEMLRLAVCLCEERNIKIVAMVHDALLIEAPIDELERARVAATQAMREASEIILSGFSLRVEAESIVYPDRYPAKDSSNLWERVREIVDREKEKRTETPDSTQEGEVNGL